MQDRDLRRQLRDRLSGRVCLMGLGNVEYGDDGFGVLLAANLVAAGVPDVVLAETAAERYIDRVLSAGYDHLVFLDAVNFRGKPGDVVFMAAAEIAARFPQISTHKISLGALARWAEADGRMKCWLLGVQPAWLGAGSELTATVRTTLEIVEELLQEIKSPWLAGTAAAAMAC